MTITYDLNTIRPYINWIYFYHAWQVSDSAEQQRLRQEAESLLQQYDGHYRCHALFTIDDAYSDGDDIVVSTIRLPMLRQQHGDCLCLADYIGRQSAAVDNRIGVFATTVDMGMETDFDSDPYKKMMMQLLADRLAEATAERMHQEVRKHYWGYAPDEELSMAELHTELFQGIRPAVGYPSLPDTSLNFELDRLLGFSKIGIRLTESGAMRPHASVSGLMIAHPKAKYFAIGKIGADQLTDYARRRGLPIAIVRRFLGSLAP